MVNYTIYDEDQHLEIKDMIHGYCRVKASKYCIINHLFLE